MNKEMEKKELGTEELEQVNGGCIIHERINIRDVVKLNPIGAIKKWINTDKARTNNKLAIYKAACENGIEDKLIYPFP